jgi:hypothetical protein
MLRNKATGTTASGMSISTKQSQSGHVNGVTQQPLRVPEIHRVVKRAGRLPACGHPGVLGCYNLAWNTGP